MLKHLIEGTAKETDSSGPTRYEICKDRCFYGGQGFEYELKVVMLGHARRCRPGVMVVVNWKADEGKQERAATETKRNKMWRCDCRESVCDSVCESDRFRLNLDSSDVGDPMELGPSRQCDGLSTAHVERHTFALASLAQSPGSAPFVAATFSGPRLLDTAPTQQRRLHEDSLFRSKRLRLPV